MAPSVALADLMENAIKPNAEALAAIMLKGEVAIVAYKPDAKWCAALGLKPGTETAVSQMPGPFRKRMIEHGDSVTSRWLRGGRTGRLFAVMHAGSVLLNFTDGMWSVEPGSTDGEAS